METRTEIVNELSSISPLMGAMIKSNVFTVPERYFDSISTTVVACLMEEQGNVNPADHRLLQDVPKGYFENLADSIFHTIKVRESAADETRDLSQVLYGIRNKNVFEVPEAYFESLHRVITGKIKTASIKKELKEIAPLLYGIQNAEMYEVPDGYFTYLPGNILRKVKPPSGKVAGMFRGSVFIKYAVAAMMTGLLTIGIYRYLDKPASGITNDSTVALLDASIEKGKNMNEQQFNEALDNLSESDIATYLEKNGNFTDVAALGNDIEENNLPSLEDYLLDEKTLENYLKEIDKTTLNN